MSSVDLIGNRTIVPLTCGPQPVDADAVHQARELLNKIAGGHRVRVDGLLGPETAEAIRNFQAAEDLPETGRLDAATLERLGMVAARVEAAREAEGPEPTGEASTPIAVTPERLAEVREGIETCRSRATVRERLAELAPRFGVVRGRSTTTTEETVADQATRIAAIFRRVIGTWRSGPSHSTSSASPRSRVAIPGWRWQ